MRITIDIPDEFISHWEKDRFEDSLMRLSADVHLLAGNYEQETVKMLIEAFRNAETERVGKNPCADCQEFDCYGCPNKDVGEGAENEQIY